MCCGRGYDTRRVVRVEKCDCRFSWCCHVTCKQCSRVVNQYTCKPSSLSNQLITSASGLLDSAHHNVIPVRHRVV